MNWNVMGGGVKWLGDIWAAMSVVNVMLKQLDWGGGGGGGDDNGGADGNLNDDVGVDDGVDIDGGGGDVKSLQVM